MNKNLSYLIFKIKPYGDEINDISFNFRPNMIDPTNHKPFRYIYFTSKFVLSKNLLKEAKVDDNPQDIFTSATYFKELMEYVKDNKPAMITKTKLSDDKISDTFPKELELGFKSDNRKIPLAERKIINKNAEYLKNIYFPKKQNFFPIKSEDESNKPNKYKVYTIRDSKITSIHPQITRGRRSTKVLVVDIDLYLIKGKDLTTRDYTKLDCIDQAKELNSLASKIFNRKIEYFYKPKKPIIKKKKSRITEILFTGEDGEQVPVITGINIKNRRVIEKVMQQRFDIIWNNLAKDYKGLKRGNMTYREAAKAVKNSNLINELDKKEKRTIQYFLDFKLNNTTRRNKYSKKNYTRRK